MAERRSRAPLFIGLAIGAVVLGSCGCLVLGPILGTGMIFGAVAEYETSAPPFQRIAPFVEADPEVRAALGEPVSVSMIVTRTMSRDLRADGEHLTLITTVAGSRREGRLSVHAENLGGQGWAGTWEVDAEATRVLRDGQYVTEGGGTIARGRFEPDGTPNRDP